MAQVKVLNWSDFTIGESESDWMPDRGFSPDSYGMNLTKRRGSLYFAEADTNIASPSGQIVAAERDTAYLGNEAYYITDEGSFCAYSQPTATFFPSRVEGNGYEYSLGFTDLISFKSNYYFTSKTTVGQFTNNLGTITPDWWSGLDSTELHPLEVVETRMYFADGNVIYYWDGTTSGTAFTLPTDVHVTTLRKHKDGQTLLAFTSDTQNPNHTESSTGKVYYCDPEQTKFTREVTLSSQVDGTRQHAGVVYCTYGDNFGYFDGSGLQRIAKQGTNTVTYSQQMDNWEDVLLWADGVNVRALGDLGRGTAMWNVFRQDTSSNPITAISVFDVNELLVGFSGNQNELDLSASGQSGRFYSNRIRFGQRVEISRIEIIHDETNASGTTSFDVHWRDESGNINAGNADRSGQIESISYTNQSVVETRIDTSFKTSVFQLAIVPTSTDVGIQEVRIYYDPIN